MLCYRFYFDTDCLDLLARDFDFIGRVSDAVRTCDKRDGPRTSPDCSGRSEPAANSQTIKHFSSLLDDVLRSHYAVRQPLACRRPARDKRSTKMRNQFRRTTVARLTRRGSLPKSLYVSCLADKRLKQPRNTNEGASEIARNDLPTPQLCFSNSDAQRVPD